MNLVKQRRAVIQYIRDKRRNPKGMVIVYKANSGQLKVGYSKCHAGDPFDKTVGMYTALQRAVPLENVDVMLTFAPTGVKEPVLDTLEKARRYFSGEPRPRKAAGRHKRKPQKRAAA